MPATNITLTRMGIYNDNPDHPIPTLWPAVVLALGLALQDQREAQGRPYVRVVGRMGSLDRNLALSLHSGSGLLVEGEEVMLGKIAMFAVFVGPLLILGIALLRQATDPYVHRFEYRKHIDIDSVNFDRDKFITEMQRRHIR